MTLKPKCSARVGVVIGMLSISASGLALVECGRFVGSLVCMLLHSLGMFEGLSRIMSMIVIVCKSLGLHTSISFLDWLTSLSGPKVIMASS